MQQAPDGDLKPTSRDQEIMNMVKLYQKAAEQEQLDLGTAGGVIIAGMLINEGLHAVADAIEVLALRFR